MAKMFNSVKLPYIPKSKFNLSYLRNFSVYMGQLFPCLVQEVLPGDKFQIGADTVIRLQPLESPLMHKLSYDIRYFYVPNRIVDENFEQIIDGFSMSINTSNSVNNEFYDNSDLIPHFSKTDIHTVVPTSGQSPDEKYQFSLWSAFGLPTKEIEGVTQAILQTQGFSPIVYPWRAYNAIYNYYYRDENIQNEAQRDSDIVRWSNYSKNDYFLSALPFPQKGITPTMSFNFAGQMAPVCFGNPHDAGTQGYTDISIASNTLRYPTNGSAGPRIFKNTVNQASPASHFVGSASDNNRINYYLQSEMNTERRGLWADFSPVQGGSFNADDLREMFAIQNFLEINAVGGTRFSEFINAHFGVYTGDYRLGKPQYLGGFKNEIVIGDIPNTSDSGSAPQGRLVGKGLGASSNSLKMHSFSEHGYIIGIFRILPVVNYAPQGFDRKWLKNHFTDWYFPEFAHLGEQPVLRGELYYDSSNTSNNEETFGYQGCYAHYRHNKDISTGYMANTYAYWNLSRKFSSQPVLNSSFIECRGNESSLMRVFAVQNEPPFIVSVGNKITAIRPIPTYPSPARLVI